MPTVSQAWELVQLKRGSPRCVPSSGALASRPYIRRLLSWRNLGATRHPVGRGQEQTPSTCRTGLHALAWPCPSDGRDLTILCAIDRERAPRPQTLRPTSSRCGVEECAQHSPPRLRDTLTFKRRKKVGSLVASHLHTTGKAMPREKKTRRNRDGCKAHRPLGGFGSL